MQDLLDNPALQAGIAPLIVALIIALLMARTPAAWLAIAAGYATMLALSTGLSFSPLTASRKVRRGTTASSFWSTIRRTSLILW